MFRVNIEMNLYTKNRLTANSLSFLKQSFLRYSYPQRQVWRRKSTKKHAKLSWMRAIKIQKCPEMPKKNKIEELAIAMVSMLI